MDDRTFRPEALRLAIVTMALALCSAAATAMFVVRADWTDSTVFYFLPANLFLAWLPMMMALGLRLSMRHTGSMRRPLIFACASLWLLFLPNAPYLITDMVHLEPRQMVPLWYDALMLVAFAWTGLALGLVSLYLVQDYMERIAGAAASWMLAATALALCGAGIYAGRFLRWNSWDVLVRPGYIAESSLVILLHPLANQHVYTTSGAFAAFLMAAYLVFVATIQLRPASR
jgi:uncharacterized membrane protein